jgi:DNA-binding NarL/FixJ family response regulator
MRFAVIQRYPQDRNGIKGYLEELNPERARTTIFATDPFAACRDLTDATPDESVLIISGQRFDERISMTGYKFAQEIKKTLPKAIVIIFSYDPSFLSESREGPSIDGFIEKQVVTIGENPDHEFIAFILSLPESELTLPNLKTRFPRIHWLS